MTRREAMHRLLSKGFSLADAETALDRAVGFDKRLEAILRDTQEMDVKLIREMYGMDSLRVIVALRVQPPAEGIERQVVTC